MGKKLATEKGTTQFPLIKHAEAIGWVTVSDTEALLRRGGESGLFFRLEFLDSMKKLNPWLSEDDALSVLAQMEGVAKNIEGNRDLLEWLRGHKTIFDQQEKRHRNVALIDFKNPETNCYQVTYEWKYRLGSRKGNRADIVFLINGVPIVIVENKNPTLGDAIDRAIVQLRRYEVETPELLTSPQLFNVTHLIDYYYGVTWNYTRKDVYKWKETPGETYKRAVQSFFNKNHILTLLEQWILFYVKDDELKKTILRQHQTRAIGKILERCAEKHRTTGLVWHTQGAGKTFTLITAARLLLEDTEHFRGATVIAVVDRNELEGQLSGWIERLLKEAQSSVAVEYATSKDRLQELLDQDFRGLIISMIHKFDDIRKDSCTRDKLFVLIDEAHRSVGGDLGNYLMGALPNATLIGFTGTPIDKTVYGKGTFKTFGKEDKKGHLDKYSIRESVEDGTTLKIRHQLAPSDMVLGKETLEKEFFALKEAEGVSDIEDLNRVLASAVNLRSVLKSKDRIEKVAKFVAQHFKENVEPMGYKAFLVAVDREACALYKKELDKYLPAEYSTSVYTKNAADVIEHPLTAQMQLSEEEEKSVRKRFVKRDENPKILIVTDKLLTGYDAPVLYAMYLDKPMRDHVLLQAIARVNRPYEDEHGTRKPCGLVVDFVGVLQELNRALSFDSDDVNGVIEGLDALLARFRELMTSPGKKYLTAMGAGDGGNDIKLDALLYETFFDEKERENFRIFFKELEGLYEVLSPSAELRDYIEDYNRLADLYVMLVNAYNQNTPMLGDLARKTEELVRRNAAMHGLDQITSVVEYDETTLAELQKQKGSKKGKIINLIKSLVRDAREHGSEEPYLISIAERAEEVLAQLEARQLETEAAFKVIEDLMQERFDADKERARLGIDAATFAIYWILASEGFQNAFELAKSVSGVFSRFPNYAVNADEMRQLRAELYKVFMPVVGPDAMKAYVDAVIDQRLGYV